MDLISLERILQEPLSAPSWLVEPLISHGGRAVVYGEWGAYKSWGLLHLGLHLASGTSWLGKFPIPHARRVLYIDEEMSQRLLHRRVKRLAIGMKKAPEAGMFRALSHYGVRLNASGTSKLLADLKKSGFDPEVVIVETLRRVLIGDEKEAKDVAEFWRSVAPILRAGKTLIVSHHMRKGGSRSANQARDRASGSTDILAGADDALAFERDRTTKDAFLVRHIKCREGEEVGPFVVTLVEDGDGASLRYEGTPGEFKAQAGKAVQAQQLAEAFLRSAPEQTARTEELLVYLHTHGISERTAQNALKSLKEHGRVTSPRRGIYQLSAAEANRKPQPQYEYDDCGGSTAAAPVSGSSASAAVPQRIAVAEPLQDDPYAMFDTPCKPQLVDVEDEPDAA